MSRSDRMDAELLGPSPAFAPALPGDGPTNMYPERELRWPYWMPGGMHEQLGRIVEDRTPATPKIETAEEELRPLYGPRGEVLKTFGGPRLIGFGRR